MSFHEQRYRKSKKIPVIRCPVMMIDYNELYDQALCDYITTLMGITDPFKISENGQLMHIDGTTSKSQKSRSSWEYLRNCSAEENQG